MIGTLRLVPWGLLLGALGCAGADGAGHSRNLLQPGSTPASTDGAGFREIVEDGFIGSFSSDGRQLAYSRTPENSGVAIVDLRTGTRRNLTTSGKAPAWSPDGRWIAYVVGAPEKGPDNEEVWLVGADGAGARMFVPQAGFPSWLPDGRGLVVQARKEARMLRITVDGKAVPEPFYDGPTSAFPGVNTDGSQLAFGREEQLQVVDRQSKRNVLRWPTPGVTGLFAAWSPDGKRLAFSGNPANPIGLWVVDLERRRAVQLAIGHYMRPSWSPDGQTLAFDLREPKRRAVWAVGRNLVDSCLARASITEGEVGFGTGLCPEALRTPNATQ